MSFDPNVAMRARELLNQVAKHRMSIGLPGGSALTGGGCNDCYEGGSPVGGRRRRMRMPRMRAGTGVGGRYVGGTPVGGRKRRMCMAGRKSSNPWIAFGKAYRKKHPGASLAEIASAYKN